MSKFTSAILGALIASAIFFAVGVGVSHAHTVDQQTAYVVFVGDGR